jgi:hypothetical protein
MLSQDIVLSFGLMLGLRLVLGFGFEITKDDMILFNTQNARTGNIAWKSGWGWVVGWARVYALSRYCCFIWARTWDDERL